MKLLLATAALALCLPAAGMAQKIGSPKAGASDRAAKPPQARIAGGAEGAMIADAARRWTTLYEAGDLDGLRTLYESDAILMTAGQPKLIGVDAIVKFLGRNKATGVRASMAFDNEEIVVDQNYGFLTARYRLTIIKPDQSQLALTGRSLLIFRKKAGKWLIWRDIDNLAPDTEF